MILKSSSLVLLEALPVDTSIRVFEVNKKYYVYNYKYHIYNISKI